VRLDQLAARRDAMPLALTDIGHHLSSYQKLITP
jgi:hypothetical protein